ncbi:MAG: hypothetical protein IJZ74_06790 [Clostridia bacterium]|nr:hypothetical protein [Clostridia bacterium]
MPNVEWEKIKAEYLAGGTSYRKLAEKYEVPRSTLEQRAKREGWRKQHEDVKGKAEAKARQKIVTQRANDIAALDRARSKLIKKLEHAVDKFPDIPGNRMEQSITETIEVKGEPNKFGIPTRKPPKKKTVLIESDLLRMATMLEKLMDMTGYVNTDDSERDDGFIDALNATSLEVTEDASDVPEDL